MSKSCYKDHNWAWQHMTCYPVLGKLRCIQGACKGSMAFVEIFVSRSKIKTTKKQQQQKKPKTKKPLQVCANQICSA